jgi:single-strand DNA-binding protein
MKSMNRVELLGNVGAEVTPRYSPQGTAFANFSLATTRAWKDRDTGEPREETEWHRIVAIGKLGEVMGDHVKKGDRLLVIGHLKTRSWEKDGIKRYTTEIIVDDFAFVGGGKGNAASGDAGTPPADDLEGEDMPF